MDYIQTIFEHAPAIFVWVGAIVTAVSAINLALLPIVKLTATQADDKILAKVGAALETVRGLLNKVGVSLPKGK